MNPNRDFPEKDSGFTENVIAIDRVARVVKGGRRFRFRALVVVGDQKGQVGIGIAKGGDVTVAVSKATEIAKKKLQTVSTINGTISHEVTGKVGGAKIFIKPAGAGTGLIAGGTVRALLEAAGIKNALSKSLGSNNKVNVAYATLIALQSVVPREQWTTTKNKATNKPKMSEEKKTVKKPAAKKEKAGVTK